MNWSSRILWTLTFAALLGILLAVIAWMAGAVPTVGVGS